MVGNAWLDQCWKPELGVLSLYGAGNVGVDEISRVVCGAGREESTGWNSGDPSEDRSRGSGEKETNEKGMLWSSGRRQLHGGQGGQ